MSDFSATDRALRLLASLEANAVDDAVHIDARIFELADVYARCAEHIRLWNEDKAYADAFTAAAAARRLRNAEQLAAGVAEAMAHIDVDAARARLEAAAAVWHDPEAAEASQRTVQAFAVAAKLAHGAADMRIRLWDVTHCGVTAFVMGSSVAETRAALNLLADRFGLSYGEVSTLPNYTQLRAVGEIDGVEVKFQRSVTSAQLADAGTWDGQNAPAPANPHDVARQLRNLAVAADLQRRTTDVRLLWSIHADYVDAMLCNVDWSGSNHITDSRAKLAGLAERLGLPYAEAPAAPAHADSKTKLSVAGEVNGVPVEFWDTCAPALSAPVEEPAPDVPSPVDDGGALNDVGRDLAEEAAVRRAVEEEGQAELAESRGWYSPDAMEYFPDAGSVPTAEELAEDDRDLMLEDARRAVAADRGMDL